MSPRARLAVALVSTTLVGYVAVGSLLGRVLGDSTYGQLALFNEVVRLVIDTYVDPVNLDRAMAGARLGMGDALDGDSAWLDAEEARAAAQVKEGDAETGLLLTRRFGFLMVVSVRSESPGEQAGVRPGDILKTIDGRHTRPLAPPTGQRLLRGAPGSTVKLTLLRAGSDPIDVSVVREKLLPLGPKGRMLEDGIGYVKVAELPARGADDVRGEVEALKRSGAHKLVLDLRGAGTGVPTEAARLAELFLPGGVVTKLKGNRVPEQVLTAEASKQAWDQPLAVLTDLGTAGAAEIAAAALGESGRAQIVGERSFGRAAVQKTFPMPEGALLLTVAEYYTPAGKEIHGRGVEPGVAVARHTDEDDEEEHPGQDSVLDKAVEVLKAPPAPVAKKAA
jgi:carboxyl-terminal processing protease